MTKIASIDIGTNTVLMLISGWNGSVLSEFEDFYEIPRIGKDLGKTGVISREKKDLLISVLSKFKEKALAEGVRHFILAGTSAFRLASNSREIIGEIKQKLDLDLIVISGLDEARLSYLGATGLSQGERFLVVDIGGGSTEVVRGNKIQSDAAISLPVGVVAITESKGKKTPPIFSDISALKEELFSSYRKIPFTLGDHDTVIAVAGTPTTLAAIKAGLDVYDENKIEGMILTTGELQEFSFLLNLLSTDEILKKYPIVKGREDVITAGNFILTFLCEYLGIKQITVSTRGLRYGMLFEFVRNNSAILTEL
ncbi:MAG: hypothetical protein IT279_09115 [Ignavibacteriaceae bacterium]|nr:hypothetical protein [Ignavibacteriaceae bacterium]